MGVNLEGLSDWGDTQHMFVDVIKSARGFAPPNNISCPSAAYPGCSSAGPFPSQDSLGWPLSDFSISIAYAPADPLNRPMTTTYPSFFGTYHLSFMGQATVSASGGVTISTTYNSSTNTTSGTAVVSSAATSLGLTFTNTQYSSGVGGVKYLQVLRPGYSFVSNPVANTLPALVPNQTFTNEFLTAIAPFAAMRYMDLMCVNGEYAPTTWAQRTPVTSPLQNGCGVGSAMSTYGLAFEYALQLANQTGKDVWINIPFGVDMTDSSSTGYMIELANFLKTNLTNPNSHVYVEYSNEVWNYAFIQAGAANYYAVKEVIGGGSNLTASGDTWATCTAAANYTGSGTSYGCTNSTEQGETYMWASRYYARQVYRMSTLLQSVLGSSFMNHQVRPILGAQFAGPWGEALMLDFLNSNYGAPSGYLYGLAVAPYWYAQSTDTTASNIISDLSSSLTSDLPGMNLGPTITTASSSYNSGVTSNDLARFYGIKSLAYEAGTDMSDVSNSSVTEQTWSNSGQAALMTTFYDQWLGCGNDLVNYYNLATPVAGQWGLYEDITVPSVRSQAINAIANTPLSQFTTCQ